MQRRKSFISTLWHFLRGHRRALIIPAINVSSERECAERFTTVRNLGVRHVHVDVSDGVFSPARLFETPSSLSVLSEYTKDFFIEAHLMVAQPLPFIESLAKIGVRRAIFHVETMSLREFTDSFFILKKKFPRLQLGIAALPETNIQYVIPYAAVCGFLECLSVPPGYSGQAMNRNAFERIAYIRENIPSCVIEADGGVNSENAGELKRAGADILISGAFLFSSSNVVEAYSTLLEE